MNRPNSCFSNTDEHLFKKRVRELEAEFESGPDHAELTKKEKDLIARMSCLLGMEHANLLREYADLIASRKDADAEWFYRKGFDDSLEIAIEYAIFS